MTRRGGVCLLVLLCGTAAWGQSLPDSTGVTQADDDGDYAEVLAELDAAGAPMSQADLEALRRQNAWTGRGLLQWRQSYKQDRHQPGTLKLQWESHGVALDLRRSRTGGLPDPWRFSIRRRTPHLDLLAGGIGLSHGFGLLCGKPGRGASLAADQTLGWSRPGLRTWPHEASGSAVTGMAGRVLIRGCSLISMIGLREGLEPKGDRWCRALQLSLPMSEGIANLSLLAISQGQDGGFSVTAEHRGRILDFQVEGAGGATRGSGPGWRATMGWVGIHAWPAVNVEAAAVWTGSGSRASQAGRPLSLTAGRGHGWALRLRLRPERRGSLKILAASGRVEDALQANRRWWGLLDLLWGWSPAPGWHGSLRWRRRQDGTDAWSESYPWLPPVSREPKVATSVAAALTRNTPRSRFQVGLRALDQRGGPTGGGTRFLLTGTGNWNPSSRWTLHGQWDTAWGQDVDLVSAVSPMRGYVIPRHWGRWREQWVMGLGRELGTWRIQAGMAGRDPASFSTADRTCLEGWLEASLRW